MKSLTTGRRGARAVEYARKAGHWDEALHAPGLPRRHWRQLAAELSRLGLEQLDRRWEIGRQLIETHGITYNVYGDPAGRARPWVLDPVPLVMAEGEWAAIEEAVAQRARLLNAVLADLYGERRLLQSGRLPAALVLSNSNYLRACVGVRPAGGVFLHSYAADLGRSADGRWWVISDRAQAPSGLGYALENRLVSARTLPAVFQRCQVRSLSGFFEMQRRALLELAPQRGARPRAVVLTPGPHNETYFEHSFLARQWGFPLVEGADLTVRENRVYLKTLAGLEPVDLIVRRLDDGWADPLELRTDSLLGVAGLMEAARAGTVAIANALGSGLAETPALMGYLPGLCEELLGEELRAPSVATWWCGEEAARRFVLEHLEQLVIKPAAPGPGRATEFPARLSEGERAELRRRIEAEPEQYVGQEQVALSTAPVRTETGLEPRHVVIRAYAGWDGNAYSVLPGGLTRVSTEADSLVVSMQLGGGSKDTWVLGPAKEFNGAPMETAREAGIPSRVADHLFWLGRYVERVEAGVRLVRALVPVLSGERDLGRAASIEAAVRLLIELNYLPEEFAGLPLGEQGWQLKGQLAGLVYDASKIGSIGWNLRQVRRAKWPLKERLSQDTWRVLQQLEQDFAQAVPGDPETRMVAQMNLLDRGIVTLSAFAGLMHESTTRGHGWRFLEMGRRIERALQSVALLGAALKEAPFAGEPMLETLLQIADSTMTYRRRYFTAMRAEFVLELLVTDESNPRSVAFQLAGIQAHMRHLPGSDPDPAVFAPARFASQALQMARRAEVRALGEWNEEGRMERLDEFVEKLSGVLCELAEALSARYLHHLPAGRVTATR